MGPASNPATINKYTASHTMVIGDANCIIEMEVAGANNMTVPPHSSVAFANGTVADIVQTGAGQTTIVAGAGVTLHSVGTALKLTAQWSEASIYQRAQDEWVVVGDVTT